MNGRALTGGQDRPLWRRGRVMTASSDPSLTLEELIQVCDQIDAECDCPVMIGPDKIDYSKDAGDNKHSLLVVTRKFGTWPPLVHVFCHRRRSIRATRTANRDYLIAEIKSRDKDVRVFDRDADLIEECETLYECETGRAPPDEVEP